MTMEKDAGDSVGRNQSSYQQVRNDDFAKNKNQQKDAVELRRPAGDLIPRSRRDGKQRFFRSPDISIQFGNPSDSMFGSRAVPVESEDLTWRLCDAIPFAMRKLTDWLGGNLMWRFGSGG